MKLLLSFIFIGILLLGFISAEHPLPTDLVNSTSGMLTGLGVWASTVTYGAFWVLMLLFFCIVMFISTARYGSTRAFGFAGVVGLLGAITLWIVGWIHWTITSAFVVAGAVGIVLMSKSRD